VIKQALFAGWSYLIGVDLEKICGWPRFEFPQSGENEYVLAVIPTTGCQTVKLALEVLR
jgi:hypothetical protein